MDCTLHPYPDQVLHDAVLNQRITRLIERIFKYNQETPPKKDVMMKTNKIITMICAAAFVYLAITNNTYAMAHPKTAHENKNDTSSESKSNLSSTPKNAATKTTLSTKEKTAKNKKDILQTPQQPSTTAATAAVNQYFNAWSSNGKVITSRNVVKQLQNPKIKNTQEAATIGAIADATNGMTTWNPSSLTSINQNLAKYGVTDAFPDSSYSKTQALTEPGFTVILKPVKGSNPQTYVTEITFTKAQLDLDMSTPNSPMYTHYVNSLQNLNASIQPNGKYIMGYSTTNPLSSNTLITQGPVGDCYFVSAVNGVLETNPAALQTMIKPVKDHADWYWVKFPGDKLPILVKLTPAEIAAASSVQGGGVWFAVLSNAEARYRITHGGNVVTDIKEKSEGSLDMLHGGSEAQTFPLLNGISYDVIKLNNESSTNLANGFQTMVSGESQMPNNPGYYAINPPAGISTSGHALLIIGYNPTTQAFITKNPWGSTGYYNPPSMAFKANQPKTQPANGNWLQMTNGVFTLPLSEVNANEFVSITVPATSENNFK
jgi:hypothetical protein